MAAWQPRNAGANYRETLYDGVPNWMQGPLEDWIARQVHTAVGQRDVALVQRFDSLSRRDQPIARQFEYHGIQQLFDNLRLYGGTLDFVDFLLSVLGDEYGEYYDPDATVELDVILAEAGSKWTVGSRRDNVALEERVPEGVRMAADSTVQLSTAGAILGEAWAAMFGRAPDYEEAYEKAIKAVEEAGVAIVCPNNPKATLGTMARDMENQGDWKLELGEDVKHPSADVPYKMVQALWAGQESRHGGNGYRKPTRGEAEAAVLLAVPLVQWFVSGELTQRP